MNFNKLPVFCVVVAALLLNCIASKRYVPNNLNNINKAVISTPEVHLILFNKSEYKLNIIHMDSLVLTGNGLFRTPGQKNWQAFSGDIPLDSIGMVLVSDTSFGNTLLVMGTGIVLMSYWINSRETDDYFDDMLNLDIEYPSSGSSSCPFVYSWNGEKFQLEGEAIGTALGKNMVMTTSTILPNLVTQNNCATIMLSNERPETHYIDGVELIAVQIPEGCFPVLDNKNCLWPVRQAVAPVAAIDDQGKKIVNVLHNKDQKYWECDVTDIYFENGFTSYIELAFPNPAGKTKGLLIVDAINTEISNIFFQQIFGFLGDECLSFLQMVEDNPEWAAILQQWLQKCALTAEIETPDGWQSIGSILPEANVVPFSRAVEFALPENSPDRIRIRLTSMADVWKLDAVSISWDTMNPVKPDQMTHLRPIGAFPEKISRVDETYLTMFPGESVTLSFATITQPDQQMCYIASVRGYLHEWLFAPTQETTLTQMGQHMNGFNKTDFLKTVLASNNNVLLFPVYTAWLAQKNTVSK